MPRKIAVLALCATLGCSDEPAPSRNPRPQPAARPAPAPAPTDSQPVILFLGTSLTAGYGVGADHAFPALIQAKLDSARLPFRVHNAGLSGETAAGGLRRLEWSLQRPLDVLVLELGANDGLRGLSVTELEANLDSIIARARHRYPSAAVVIAGMQAPPNLGAAYTTEFRAVYRDVADRHDAVLIPFLLDGVAAKNALNLDDGIHPNEDGHKRIAETVWRVLAPLLEQRVTAR